MLPSNEILARHLCRVFVPISSRSSLPSERKDVGYACEVFLQKNPKEESSCARLEQLATRRGTFPAHRLKVRPAGPR